MLNDLRYALRLLYKNPGFTAVATLVLALGIGANTAIFSVVDAVLLRPLPYPNQERIVSLTNFWRKTGVRGTVSAPDYHDWHDQAKSFERTAAYTNYRQSVTVNGAADYTMVTSATPDFFGVFGVQPALGRLPSDDEQQSGGPLTVVVSYAFWTTKLGGDRAALGRSIKFEQRLFTVVGVLPPQFRFPSDTDVWAPWWITPETTSRSAHNYRAVALLKPNVTVEQAQAEMEAIGARLERAYPQTNDSKTIAVDLLLDNIVRSVRTTLTMIFGVVLVVLLIACANVSNLLLARATARTRELGIRAALGASRMRVVRQLVTESVLLAALGGLASVVIAAWGIRGLVALAPAGLPRIGDVDIHARVLLFALGVSLLASLVFGLAPALHASRNDLNQIIKQGGRATTGTGGSRMRAALIVFETAGAVVLVLAAGLLIRSYAALSRVDLGFRPERLLIADTSVPVGSAAQAVEGVRFYRALLPQIAALPSVEAAAAVLGAPTDPRSNGGYAIEGGQTFEQMGVRSPQATFAVATPRYFATIGVPIMMGRDFTDADNETAPLVTIVNQAFVRQSFPDGQAIGRRIRTGYDGTGFMTIVGIVADIRAVDPAKAPSPQIYMPSQQHPFGSTAMTLVVRTATRDPLQLSTPIVQSIRRLNPDVPVRVSTMEALVEQAAATARFRTVLLGIFAAVALLLAMAGVYGIVSFIVSQRTGELGLRMALGAQPREIVALTLASGVRLTMAGVAVGWIAALAVGRLLSSMLFATSERDPIIFIAVPALLVAVAAVASLAPAIRAASVDPVTALKAE